MNNFENEQPPVSAPTPSSSADKRINLPRFWRHSPQHWIIHVEAVFQYYGIESDILKVNNVLMSLDEEEIQIVSDLLGGNVNYANIRSRLISSNIPTRETPSRSVMQHGDMGNCRPTQLLRDMRRFLPQSTSNVLLKQFLLHSLSPAIRNIISGLHGSLDSLAKHAEKIMDYARRETYAASSADAFEHRFRALEDIMAALPTSQSNQDNRSGSTARRSSRPRSRPLQNRNFCYYHNKFGNMAIKCHGSCSFHSENN